MLTGTCDVCHETMAFEEHLAGTTIRCDQCGRGRVRVPSTAITASVPDFAKKQPINPPDTAVTDRPFVPLSLWDEDHRPAVATCPRCGSASFRRLKPGRGTARTDDRECKECGTRYTTIPAPLSSAVRTAMYVSGAIWLLAGALSGLLWLAAMPGPRGGWGTSFPLVGVYVALYCGCQILFGPMRRQLLREKRLIEYKVFASPDRPPPVEIPRPPDMVFLSAWFGAHSLALSLGLPLVASLLFVVVFAAAAVVCGVIALSQAHLRGLIGIGLGVVSLIVWGLVFVYFLQR